MSTPKQWMVYGTLLVLTIVSLSLAGCGASGRIVVDEQDDGTQVELKQGQTLVVRLSSNPTTGYSWAQPEGQASDVLVMVGEPEFKSESTLVGAGGTETLRFRADRPGKATLQLVYRRPWEKDAEPAGVYTLEVSVR